MTPSCPLAETARRDTMLFSEIVSIAIDSFRASKVRFVLTALGLDIGTASLIVVVTIGLSGKQYVLGQIQGIGANMIYAYYQGGSNVSNGGSDYLTAEDVKAVPQQVPAIHAASHMLERNDRIAIGSGKERDILVLGVSPEYSTVRNLEILAGRFFDEADAMAHAKAAVVTQQFAKNVYGSEDAAIYRNLKINSLPFTIIGTFLARLETLGQSELAATPILVPYDVARHAPV